jgi:phosphopantothenoylcysteine decarboxylase/phosphopantothenate--cysteine ligase
MGVALAEAARARGAEVTLVAGGMSVDPPATVRVERVATTADMQKAMTRHA